MTGTVLLGLAACSSGDAPRGWNGEVRDSAGIRIVENRNTTTTAPRAWSVTPSLSIGSVEGDSAFLFSRVADVAIDGQRRILVLDQQSRDVRVFDASGVFLHRIGRPGEGPGELSAYVTSVLVGRGDTVFVPDYAQRRINVFAPTGEHVGDIAIAPRPGGRSWELLEDGRFLFRGITIGRDAEGRFQTWDALLATAPAAAPLDTLIVFDYPASPLGAPGQPVAPLIVNAAIWTRLHDGRIAWSSLDRNEILIHGPAGELQRVVRHLTWQNLTPEPAANLALRDLLRTRLELIGGDAAGLDLIEIVEPERLPALTSLRAAPDGTLWVQLMGEVAEIDPMAINDADGTGWLGGSTWHILDGDGRFLQTIRLPARFNLMRITDNALYGVLKDGNDVEHVVRLALSVVM